MQKPSRGTAGAETCGFGADRSPLAAAAMQEPAGCAERQMEERRQNQRWER